MDQPVPDGTPATPRAAPATTPPPRTAAETPPVAEPAGATGVALQLIRATPPDQVHGDEIRDAIAQASPADQPRLAEEVATKAASRQAIASFSDHLLAQFAPVMPTNPRLVKRVANAYGMLEALQLQLGRRDPKDLIARAAIMLVRYPTLVDQLLSDPDPPTLDAPTQTRAATASDDTTDASHSNSPWWRRDVQQLLRYRHGTTPIDITALAGCYGREYPPSITGLGTKDPDPASPSGLPPT